VGIVSTRLVSLSVVLEYVRGVAYHVHRPSGKITLGDILEIMPFDDPVVCLEVCCLD
jgi:hypothetical protein